MRILANENFPGEAVEALRAAGHDVLWVTTNSPGISDREVLAIAVSESRFLMTFDKDFGELAHRSGLPGIPGILLFRVSPSSPSRIAELAVSVLGSGIDLTRRLAVVEENRIRTVPLLEISK